MGRKGQGSTEYIALVALALIVMLVAVSFFIVEPQFAYSAKKQRSDDYWANARPFAVKSYAMAQGRAVLELQNADPLSLSIKGIKLKNISVNFSQFSPTAQSTTPMCAGGLCDLPMNPGQSALVVTDDLSMSAILQQLCFSGNTFQEGRYYEAELSITYQDTSGSGESETSDVPLVGQCMKVTVNTTGCQAQSGNCSSSADCCSGNCQGGACACMGQGGACASGSQCCSSICSSGACSCSSDGVSCSSASQCCSGACSGGVCATLCQGNGISCLNSSGCCSGYCSGGACACAPSGASCSSDSQCCSDVPYCAGGACASCKSSGISCANDTQCCSGLSCTNGACQAPSCSPNGVACSSDSQCCGYCNSGSCASCKDNAVSCSGAAECCSGVCSGGACASCVGGGEACALSSQCCPSVPYCSGGACAACVANGNSCTLASQCCGGNCNSGACAAVSTLSIGCPASTGTVGFAYSSPLSASGGSGTGYSYSATSLPSNLTLSGDTISGTPTSAETTNFTAFVTDSAGNSASRACSITIGACGSQGASCAVNMCCSGLACTSGICALSTLSLNCSSSTAKAGTAYSSPLSASGGTGAGYVYSANGLPSNLTLSGDTISGTPLSVGVTAFTASVNDSAGTSTSKSCSINASCAAAADPCTSSPQCCSGLACGTDNTCGAPPAVDPPVIGLSGSQPPSHGLVLRDATAGPILLMQSHSGLAMDRAPVGPIRLLGGINGGNFVRRNDTVYCRDKCPSSGSGVTYTYKWVCTNCGILASSPGSLPITTLSANDITIALVVTATNKYGTATATSNELSLIDQLNITCPASTAKVGTAYSSGAVASGGTTPYISYAKPSGSLPSGLSLNTATGAITGIPTVKGASAFTVLVTDSAGDTATSPACSINASPIDNGGPCTSNEQCLSNYCNPSTGVCETPPVCMPEGWPCPTFLGIATPCCASQPYCVSGACAACKPGGTACGSSSECCAAAPYCSGGACAACVANGNSCTSASQCCGGNCNSGACAAVSTLSITCPAATTGTVGTPYSSSLSASGGSGTGYAYSAGTLPAGLSRLGAAITGTPSAAGTTTFTVSVTDSAGNSGSKSCSITISSSCPAVSIATSSLPPGIVGTYYSTTLSATGGSGFSWSASGLPSGLALTSADVISGTPLSSGTPSVTVSANNSCGSTASKALPLTIYPAITITCPASPAVAGTYYSQSASATGGSGSGYTYSISGFSILGLSAASGTISGTATTGSTSDIYAVSATDGAGNSNSKSCTLSVNCAPDTSSCTVGSQCCLASACGTNSICGQPPVVGPPSIG